ncbi:MAG: 4Fe-4S binding protein [Actinomycetia bacterium]|nr:4Fe-4S binding protein [Actinomycetes bacterium]
MVWSVITSRPFCRFICPLGAIYSIFNKISAFQFKIDEEVCIKCEKCNQVCPMKIDVLKGSQQSQCIRCMECVKACQKNAIKI